MLCLLAVFDAVVVDVIFCLLLLLLLVSLSPVSLSSAAAQQLVVTLRYYSVHRFLSSRKKQSRTDSTVEVFYDDKTLWTEEYCFLLVVDDDVIPWHCIDEIKS